MTDSTNYTDRGKLSMPSAEERQSTHHFGDSCPGGHVSDPLFYAAEEARLAELEKAVAAEKTVLNGQGVNREALIRTATQLLSGLPGWAAVAQNHTARTPERFISMLLELTSPEEFNFTTFENPNPEKSEMIVLGPIPFHTLCAHHVVPFYGSAHIGYVPEDRVAGLSKFARLVRQQAKGLWTQEALTSAIAEELYGRLEPKGTAVVLRGEHMCMSIRGVQTPGVITTTSDMRGCFADHNRLARQEFFELIAGDKK